MAKLIAPTAFRYEDILLDLNGLLQGSTRHFDDDQPQTWHGTTYQDAYRFDLPLDNGKLTSVAFLGQDLSGSDSGLSGGAVTGIGAEYSAGGGVWSPKFTLYDFSLAATTLWSAVQTADDADDEAVLASILSGTDIFTGSAAGDRMRGYGGDDILRGNGGADWLSGDAGSDTIEGGAGNDSLLGGAGGDVMRGGSGDDVYVVDSLSDHVLERTVASAVDTGGIDTVLSSISLHLGSGLERLVLTGTASIYGHGSAHNETITGNSGNNWLIGGSGDDLLAGGRGQDRLEGSAGRDTLDGQAGADTILVVATLGGTQSSSNSGRVVVSGANNDTGEDTLRNFDLVNDTLYVWVNNVASFVHGTDTAIGTGAGVETPGSRSSFASNVGLVNVDRRTATAWGDDGDIVASFVTPSSTLTEAGFEARLRYFLAGNDDGNELTGGQLADSISGEFGNDTLTGGMGQDTLSGGVGADVFRINTAAESGPYSKRDRIHFEVGSDLLDLRGIDADATAAGNQAFLAAFIASTASFTEPGQLKLTGRLLRGNTDEDAEAEFSVLLIGAPGLSEADILL